MIVEKFKYLLTYLQDTNIIITIMIISIIVFIVYIFIYAYFAGKKYNESFANMNNYPEFIFDNYVTNKNAQQSFKSLTQPQPFKTLGVETNGISSIIQNILDKTATLTKPEPKCLACENVINKTVFFKQGATHYLGYDYKTNTVRMLSKEEVTNSAQFMKSCCWKLVIGLSGDANTCSILHMEQDAYLTRLPDNTIIIQPAEIIQGNELLRQMGTFYLIDGLNSRADTSLMPLSIGKELHVRVVEVFASGKPYIVKYASEHVVDYKAATFNCIDSINEYPIITNRFTVNGNHRCKSYNASVNQDSALTSSLEPFHDVSNSSSGKRCNKSSSKRLLASCLAEGEFTDAELTNADIEHFQNDTNTTNTTNTNTPKNLQLFSDDFNPQTANIFDNHTGAEFNAILNAGVSQKRNELTDNIFYKLEDAKMNPDVNNLLEYNESRYNIYKKENNDFESKIYDRIQKYTNTIDDLIVNMNNYRVKNMAQDFFFLGDKLIKSRGNNN